MSKLSELKRFGAEDFSGAPDWFIEKYLPGQNAFNEDVFGRINGDISLDNTNNAVKSVKLVHGVPKLFSNPLAEKRLRPTGLYAIASDGLPVQGVTWKNAANGQIEVTVQFAPPFGLCAVRNSANQLVATGAITPVLFDTEELEYGFATHSTTTNTTRITFSKSGIISVKFSGSFQASVTPGQRFFWISKNGNTNVRWGNSRPQAQLNTQPFQVSGTSDFSVSENDYIELIFQHELGASANILGDSGATDCCRLSAQYIAPPVGYSANVKFYIVGG